MNQEKLLSELLTSLIHEDGSDLHLGAGRKPAMRINGQLLFLVNQEVMTREDMVEVLNVLIGKDRTEKFLIDKEVDFSYSFKGDVHLRGNAFFQRGSISIALRLIPKAKSLEELNLPPILSSFTGKNQGFFLVVGPVGQGKSTTLSTMINMINKDRAAHIVTIEDPIEFIYEPDKSIIDQREVGDDTADFSVALKSVFREDVNVIFIGEMRSPETIAAAVTAAETGHLVFSTMHTNSASQSIERIVDSFKTEEQPQILLQLSMVLEAILSQRLIPTIDGKRVLATEILIVTPAVRNNIRESKTFQIDNVIQTSGNLGMRLLENSLAGVAGNHPSSLVKTATKDAVDEPHEFLIH